MRIVSICAVALAVTVGVAQAPRLLEPGRSEREGIVLPPHVVGATRDVDADWSHDATRAAVRADEASVTLEATAAGLQLVSRPLAVVPDRCYVARLELATSQRMMLAVLTSTADSVLYETDVLPSAVLRPSRLEFRSEGPRLTLALFAQQAGTITILGNATLRPRRC